MAFSEVERFYTDKPCEPLGAITRSHGTGQVTPVVAGNRPFMRWTVDLECPEAECDNSVNLLQQALPQWGKSLRAVLER